MTSSMTLFVTKIISMADSFDSISTNVGGRSTYQIERKIYTTKFGQPVCLTMTRSLRSRTPSTCAVLKRKAEDPPMSALTKNRTANAENDDFRANLLTRLFDRMVRGIWLRVLPTDDDFDDVSSAMKQDWEDLLPLLVEHNMIKCKVTDDVESYEYVKASWECFQTMTRDTLDIRTTPVRQPGTPLTWYISLGDPQYNKPVHQLKAIKEKKFAYMEYRHSPQDDALRRELRTLSKKILLDKAQSRLDSARKVHTNKEVLDYVLKQNGFRNASKFEEAIDFALHGLDFERHPRLDRVGVNEMKLHNRTQASERERTMVLFTATLWGWKDPSLTKSRRFEIAKGFTL
jgi:hypothetical protein